MVEKKSVYEFELFHVTEEMDLPGGVDRTTVKYGASHINPEDMPFTGYGATEQEAMENASKQYLAYFQPDSTIEFAKPTWLQKQKLKWSRRTIFADWAAIKRKATMIILGLATVLSLYMFGQMYYDIWKLKQEVQSLKYFKQHTGVLLREYRE